MRRFLTGTLVNILCAVILVSAFLLTVAVYTAHGKCKERGFDHGAVALDLSAYCIIENPDSGTVQAQVLFWHRV